MQIDSRRHFHWTSSLTSSYTCCMSSKGKSRNFSRHLRNVCGYVIQQMWFLAFADMRSVSKHVLVWNHNSSCCSPKSGLFQREKERQKMCLYAVRFLVHTAPQHCSWNHMEPDKRSPSDEDFILYSERRLVTSAFASISLDWVVLLTDRNLNFLSKAKDLHFAYQAFYKNFYINKKMWVRFEECWKFHFSTDWFSFNF